MFCRKCGKTLLDGDRFCSYCGAQVIERKDNQGIDEREEEVIYNKEMTLGVLEEDISENGVMQEKASSTYEESNEKDLDKKCKPNWNLEGFPLPGEEHKKTEDIKVDWENQDLLKFETTFANNREVEKVSKLQEKPDMKLETKMDIFELFDEKQAENKTLEDNQDLINPTLEQELFGEKNNKSDKLHTFEEEQIDKFYTFSKKNEEFQKLLDKEYDRLKQVPEFIAPKSKILSNIENLEIKINEGLVATSLTQEENIFTENNIGEMVELVQELTEDNSENSIKTAIEDNSEKLIEKQTEEQKEEQKEEQMESNSLKELEKEPENDEAIEFSVLPWDETESRLGGFTDEDAGKKISPMFIVLSIIIVLLSFEIVILGIKYFLPESSAAEFVNNKLGVTVNWVDSLKTNNKDQEIQQELENQDQIENGGGVKEVNTISQLDDNSISKPELDLDKDTLVDEALSFNINIIDIMADDSLAYVENKDYGDKNINNSKIIENNIWYQGENGNTKYYDKEIIKTIIQFDSAWIDYVNKKDTLVLTLTKEGSPAYKNVEAFSKAGKVTKSFDFLKIGEIRQSEDGFYLWTEETITTIEAGNSSTNNYKWIYYIQPIDNQMKIVSYKRLY